MRELFIYYRVRSGKALAAQDAVTQLQARLRTLSPRLIARLLRRPDEENELQTWMETYALDNGITEAMQAHIEAEAVALLPLIEGPRHVEAFVACVS